MSKPIVKLGEATVITPEHIQPVETLLADADLEIENRMRKFAQNLKAIAPRANDFLYFTCVMMHAAEAALLDDKGEFRKLATGEPVSARWEPAGKDSIRWVCTDTAIRPYKNSNNDIFPETELIAAHKKWVGRPLCLDHKSASVDMVRGVIVDTFYDEKRKRVIALAALDKKNYGDLADKVASGVATNVSMGTAVGRAICTECFQVARTEADFCQHMRNKSCYGEVNLDLAPIELSIVVSGADPQAKIKHIIAKDLSSMNNAAQALADYVDGKLAKGAEISSEDLAQIQEDLESLTKRVANLVEASASKSEETTVSMTGSTESMQGVDTDNTDRNIAPPSAIPGYASDLQRAVLGARTKIAKLQEDINNLSSIVDEEQMAKQQEKKAYYQGTVEPNAGGVTYPPQPGQEARNDDKHMHGPPPFPGVGPVDGMYPGVGESDAEVKRRLQRQAEAEQRKMKRDALVEQAKNNLKPKQAYPQGTEEPKKYPVDPGQNARNDDKHLKGAPPFPGVGNVEGLYGDDMATKEKLLRASLKAKFSKVSSPSGQLDLGNSRWDVYADDKLILTATVDQITRGNSENLFKSVATEAFGKELLTRIKTEGYAKTRDALTKQAAPPAGAAGAPPGAPAAEPPEPAAPPAAPEEAPPEPGEPGMAEPDAGALLTELKETHETMGQQISDLSDVMGVTEAEAEAIPEEIQPADEGAFEQAADDGMATTASLQSMRKTLNGMLRETVPNTIGELQAHQEELKLAAGIYATKLDQLDEKQRKYLDNLTADGIKDAKKTVADAKKLLAAFVKYAHGTDSLVKRAQDEGGYPTFFPGDEPPEQTGVARQPGVEELLNPAGAAEMSVSADPVADAAGVLNIPVDIIRPVVERYRAQGKDLITASQILELPEFASYVGAADDGAGDEAAADVDALDADAADVLEVSDAPVEDEGAVDEGADEGAAADSNAADPINVVLESGAKLPPDVPAGSTVTVKAGTKQERAEMRTKLAQKGLMTLEQIWNQGHPGPGPEAPNLDVKPSGDLAKVEKIDETQKAMLELAKMPPRVRKQAEEIARLVTAGKLPADKVDELVAHGVDPDAVKYYKAFWGEAKDPKASEFAAKLTAEHAAQKQAEELQTERVRIKRAYELAYQMREKGVIEANQVDQQVDEIMKWNDEGFNSVKNIVARQAPLAKQASVPEVGLLSTAEVVLPSATPASQDQVNVKDVFDDYFKDRKF